ncbi:transmembrane protein PVRIG [Emydura macquarii macquarii]|uniref:transmembrane protein PVRIG n=1 Tax=Emydura macquarii macquarii TaxID=1129001 RepID=UPI00352BA8E7
MAGPARFPLTALLLSHCLDTGTSKAGLKIWADDPMALGSPLHLHCTFLGQEHVTLVSWWRVGPNRSREDLAVIHATHGAHLPPALRGLLQVTNVSDGRVGLTLPSLGPPDNGTRFCCKFSTFPSGVSEQCLDLLLPEPVPDSPGAPQAALRAEVLGTLGAGAFFLLGSVVVLGHLVRARRRRTLLVSGPHPCLPSSQETPMALWVQQGLPGQHNSFSAPYVLINLDYFTPQPNATAHGGLLPPPAAPRPGRARGQDPGQSRANHGGPGREEQGPGRRHKT